MAGKTILVVDDEPHIRSLVKSVLVRQQHRVVEAADGVEAEEVLQRPRAKIDLILTDVIMPRMDGIELAERTSSRTPAVRLIFMSGKCEADAVRQDMETKGFGFIRKPFDLDELSRTVRQFLARRRRPATRRREA